MWYWTSCHGWVAQLVTLVKAGNSCRMSLKVQVLGRPVYIKVLTNAGSGLVNKSLTLKIDHQTVML